MHGPAPRFLRSLASVVLVSFSLSSLSPVAGLPAPGAPAGWATLPPGVLEGTTASPPAIGDRQLPGSGAPLSLASGSADTTEPAESDSSRAAPGTPFYKRKAVLAGVVVVLAGALALALSGGDDDPRPTDTRLPGFPPPPSSQP